VFFGVFANAVISMFYIFASGKITIQNVLFANETLAMKSRFKSDHTDFGWLWH